MYICVVFTTFCQYIVFLFFPPVSPDTRQFSPSIVSCGQSGGTYDVTVRWNANNTDGADINNYYVTLLDSLGVSMEFAVTDNNFTVNGLNCSANHSVSVVARSCAGNSTEATTIITNPGE